MEGCNKAPMVPTEMTNVEIKEALLTLDRSMTTQENRDIGPRVNAMDSTITSRLREFVRMNHPTLFGSKVGEDHKAFLDVVNYIVDAMGMTFREKTELDFNQLKDVDQVWFT